MPKEKAADAFYAYLRDVLASHVVLPGAVHVGGAIDALNDATRVFVIGNGGSMATAMHFANDLMKYLTNPIKAVVPTNLALLTAYANDHGYDDSLARWLDAWDASGSDVLFAVTCSGRSRNIVSALMETNAQRIVLTAAPPTAPCARASDVLLCAGARDIRKSEDIHAAICHALIEALEVYREA